MASKGTVKIKENYQEQNIQPARQAGRRCGLKKLASRLLGATETAEHENVALSKMQGWKLRDVYTYESRCVLCMKQLYSAASTLL